jgi:hypothetical protein
MLWDRFYGLCFLPRWRGWLAGRSGLLLPMRGHILRSPGRSLGAEEGFYVLVGRRVIFVEHAFWVGEIGGLAVDRLMHDCCNGRDFSLNS